MSDKSRSWVIRKRWAACAAVHNMWVGATDQMFRANCIDVVTNGEDRDEAVRQILVEFDLQRLIGVSSRGRSSWAEAAANAIAARTSSSERVGKSASISAVVAPSARLASTVF